MGRRNLTIRVSDEEMEWLKQEANAQMRPISNFIMWAVQQYKNQKDQTLSALVSGSKASDKD